MSDFINKIYNSPYFIIGLFVAIVILAIIFVVLVFSGKKKKNKNGENLTDQGKKLEENLATINNASVENNQAAPVVNNQEVTPVVEQASVNEVSAPAQAPVTTPEVSNPVDIAAIPSTPQTPEQPVAPAVEETPANPNAEIFNTSIFHGMPEELAQAVENVPTPAAENVAIGEKVEEEKPDVTQGLFEPAPDLSNVAVDVPVAPSEEPKPVVEATPVEPTPNVVPVTPAFDLPNLNQIPEEKPEVDLPKPALEEKPDLGAYQERIQTPNQFSSVYINKEEPKPEPIVPQPKSDKPPYDPTLFTSVNDPVPEIKPVMPDPVSAPVMPSVETPIQPVDMPTVNVTEVPVNNEPQIDIPTPQVPPMDLPNFDVVPPIGQTSNDGGNMEMPNLTGSNDDANTGLPSFNNETFNIK